MKIIKSQSLNPKQKSDIRALIRTCKAFEPISGYFSIDSSKNIFPDLNSFYMAYDSDILTGALSIFISSENECEIYAYTLPELRRKHIFSDLLSCALSELHTNHIKNIYFVAEPGSISAHNTVSRLNMNHCHSEYLLMYNKNLTPIPKHLLSLDISSSDNIEQIEINKAECCIGTCNIYNSSDSSTIFDFEIKEQYRNKGYGTESLLLFLEYLIENHPENEILLQVSSNNQKAHRLYTTHGFIVKEQIDYWSY